MKKLKLNLKGKMLSKDEMKKVQGGYGGCRLTCYVENPDTTTITTYYCSDDNCWFSSDGNCMYCGQNFYPDCCDTTEEA